MPLHKKRTWILTADTAKAKIFEWIPEHKNLKEIISLDDRDARKHERDLKADRPGHGQGFASKVRYAVEDPASFKQQASDAFLKKLASFISETKTQLKYDAMVVISPDEVYCSIRDNLSPEGQDKITRHHAKNLTNMPASDLSEYYVKQLTLL